MERHKFFLFFFLFYFIFDSIMKGDQWLRLSILNGIRLPDRHLPFLDTSYEMWTYTSICLFMLRQKTSLSSAGTVSFVLCFLRSSLMGFDLNRHWQEPSPWAHPTVYATKNLVLDMDRNEVIRLCV